MCSLSSINIHVVNIHMDMLYIHQVIHVVMMCVQRFMLFRMCSVILVVLRVYLVVHVVTCWHTWEFAGTCTCTSFYTPLPPSLASVLYTCTCICCDI